MADVIVLAEIQRARRRAREHAATRRCVEIVEANLRLALHRFAHGPEGDRPVRARQVRQLAELLEYITARDRRPAAG